MGLVGMSDDVVGDDPDVDRAVADRLGDPDGRQLVPDPPGADRHQCDAATRSPGARAIGITHLLLVVMLYLMIFKPGSSLT